MASKSEKKKVEETPVEATKQAYYVPQYNVAVEAESIEEAIEIAKKKGNR